LRPGGDYDINNLIQGVVCWEGYVIPDDHNGDGLFVMKPESGSPNPAITALVIIDREGGSWMQGGCLQPGQVVRVVGNATYQAEGRFGILDIAKNISIPGYQRSIALDPR